MARRLFDRDGGDVAHSGACGIPIGGASPFQVVVMWHIVVVLFRSLVATAHGVGLSCHCRGCQAMIQISKEPFF